MYRKQAKPLRFHFKRERMDAYCWIKPQDIHVRLVSGVY